MNTVTSPLGTCPRCNTTIPTSHLLIEYERNNQPAAYAECPSCQTIVRPTQSDSTPPE